MATLIHSASCKRFFQVELARKEGGEFGKPPRVDGGARRRRRRQAPGFRLRYQLHTAQLVKPLSVQICFFF